MSPIENRLREGQCIAFEGHRRIAFGGLPEVARAVKAADDRGTSEPVLVFDAWTSQVVEIDTRGSVEDVLGRLPVESDGESKESKVDAKVDASVENPPARGRGRPKLGVVGREVTLLPRHWQWLSSQPGGASVTLRKLVERARRENADVDRRRQAQNSAYRFMSAMAGNLPGFEEATRALFAGDPARFDEQSEPWPGDIRDHARALAGLSFSGAGKPA